MQAHAQTAAQLCATWTLNRAALAPSALPFRVRFNAGER